MAMPGLENANFSKEWLVKLSAKVAATPGGLDRTVFELQTVNWKAHDHPISTEEIVRQMRLLQVHGVRHLGYYPDDFLKDHPVLKVLRPAFSASDYLSPQVEGDK
jgi:biofilm PGA synthesis lipoprotein PgaB